MSQLYDILYTKYETAIIKIAKVKYDIDPDVITHYPLEEYMEQGLQPMEVVELIVGDIIF